MFDINAVINSAITEAVQACLAQVKQEHLNAIGLSSNAAFDRLADLEAKLATLTTHGVRTFESVDDLRLRVTALENKAAAAEAQLMAARDRISFLEDQAVVTSNAQGDRITALETKLTEANLFTQMTPATITADAFVTHLDKQEWFWGKVADFINREFDGRGIVSEGRVEELIEEAMDSHHNAYDHDGYDTHVGDDDKHFDGDINDAVRDAISNMSFEVSIR